MHRDRQSSNTLLKWSNERRYWIIFFPYAETKIEYGFIVAVCRCDSFVKMCLQLTLFIAHVSRVLVIQFFSCGFFGLYVHVMHIFTWMFLGYFVR